MRKLHFYLWIAISKIVRFFHSIIYRSKKADAQESIKLSQMALDHSFSLEKLRDIIYASKLKWTEDYWKGRLDNITYPWVTLAKGGDDCDGLSNYMVELLDGRDAIEEVFSLAVIFRGGGHVVTPFRIKGREAWNLISNTYLYNRQFKSLKDICRRQKKDFKYAFLYTKDLKLIEIIENK